MNWWGRDIFSGTTCSITGSERTLRSRLFVFTITGNCTLIFWLMFPTVLFL